MENKNLIKKYVALALCIILVYFSLVNILTTFHVIFEVIHDVISYFTFGNLLTGLLTTVGCVLRAVASILATITLFFIYQEKPKDINQEIYMLLPTLLIDVIGIFLIKLFEGYLLYIEFFKTEFLFVLLPVVGLIVLDTMEENSFLSDLSTQHIKDSLTNAAVFVIDQLQAAKEDYERTHPKKEKPQRPQPQPQTQQQTQTNDPIGSMLQSANRSYGYVDTNRTPFKVIVFGLLTCGIYRLIAWYSIIIDVNKVCNYDNDNTPGLVKIFVFSILTCGIYEIIWAYNLANRIKYAGEYYNVRINDDGTSFLLFNLLGLISCGLFTLVAWIHLIQNINRVFEAYNKANGYVQ